MKLSRIYSNQDRKFSPIEFNAGLNVVLAEIRLPENRGRDTHNLGKTTLGRLLDFCLLLERDKNFFLFKHLSTFEDFVFFLEIELEDGAHITIRRSVQSASKICFKRHQEGRQDLSGLAVSEWDHQDISFDRAKKLLDGILGWDFIKPWHFRKGLGYLLRTQEDYTDVFHLRKFAAKHMDWKPFLSHLLGFNSALVESLYRKEEELSELKSKAETLLSELGGKLKDEHKIEGILILKRREVEKAQAQLDKFDFRAPDKKVTKELVDEIDKQIAQLNNERYYLRKNKNKLDELQKNGQLIFDPEEASELFAAAGAAFEGQIKRDFEQLIAFNKAITSERNSYLVAESDEVNRRLKTIGEKLNSFGRKRAKALSFLRETDIFDKYKQLSEEMVVLRADIESLERQKDAIDRLRKVRRDIRAAEDEREGLHDLVEMDVAQKNADEESLFSQVRFYFSEIVESVISRKALLSASINSAGHIEFGAEILDGSGNATSADAGHTYKKLLCVAFDLAVLRSHIDERFPYFVFHDGIFESLDDRKKENLLGVIREYADIGLQPIITLIDSDIPVRDPSAPPVFSDDEIVLCLNDEGEEGRLFKMPAW